MNIQNDAFAALRYRDFSIVTLNQFCLTLAILIQEIIVAYSLYQITRDPLTLGFIGLAEAIPFITLSLWGGYFADKLNKNHIDDTSVVPALNVFPKNVQFSLLTTSSHMNPRHFQ